MGLSLRNELAPSISTWWSTWWPTLGLGAATVAMTLFVSRHVALPRRQLKGIPSQQDASRDKRDQNGTASSFRRTSCPDNTRPGKGEPGQSDDDLFWALLSTYEEHVWNSSSEPHLR